MTCMKFTILVHPSLAIITMYLVCLINAWESREKDFLKQIMHFHYTTYMATPQHKNPWGSWNLQFWCFEIMFLDSMIKSFKELGPRHNNRYEITRDSLTEVPVYWLKHFHFWTNRQGQFCRSWSYLFVYYKVFLFNIQQITLWALQHQTLIKMISMLNI